jgi:hypothetical protein
MSLRFGCFTAPSTQIRQRADLSQLGASTMSCRCSYRQSMYYLLTVRDISWTTDAGAATAVVVSLEASPPSTRSRNHCPRYERRVDAQDQPLQPPTQRDAAVKRVPLTQPATACAG